MKRLIIRIVPHAKTRTWRAQGGDGITRAWREWSTKAAAVGYYVGVCRYRRDAGELAQLVVHRRDGTIQYERPYGKDPKRTKG